MTNRIWKLLGFLLVACLLLSGVSALAEKDGKVTVHLDIQKEHVDDGRFTDATGIEIEMFKVGVPTGVGSSWGPTADFSAVSFEDYDTDEDGNKKYTADQIAEIVKAIEATLENNPSIERVTKDPKVTEPVTTGDNTKVQVVFDRLEPGIYYIRKVPSSRPRKMTSTGTLISIPSLGKDNQDVVNKDPYELNVHIKYEFPPIEKTKFTATKIWRDDDDFDGIQPPSITVHLWRQVKPSDTPVEVGEATILRPTPDADGNVPEWKYTWENIDKEDENGDPYIFTVTEDRNYDWGSSYGKEEIEYKKDAENANINVSATITNPHTPDYCKIKLTKKVTVGGKPTKSTLADGTYKFTITGPIDLDEKRRNASNYWDGDNPNDPKSKISLSIINGDDVSTGKDGLMPGKYIIKEITDGLPAAMVVVEGAEQTVEIKANEEKEVIFTNNLNAGDLIITKKVTLNGRETTDARLNGTYKFTVTGPDQYLANVEITVKDGKSDSKTLTDLVPGEYTVTENTDNLPAGVSATSGSGDTITVVAGDTVNATITNDLGIGSIKITKTVTVNGKATTGTQADGTYTFTVKGPSYPTGHTETIKITKGAANSVQLDNLLAGSYTVSEVTSKLPSKMTLSSTNDLRLNVTGGTVTDASFTNDLTTTTTTRPPVVVNPTPTPNPTISINGQKIWNDEGNVHNTRPNSIIVHLLRNGAQIQEINLDGTGDRWSYRFSNLPQFDANGADYVYTVRESDVAGYTGTVDGFTIVNDLIPQNPNEYTNFTGQKTWNDANNADGVRPNYIIIRLIRDGEEVDRRTVTAANSWQYTFQNVPLDDGYGHEYTYAIREDAVPGYVTRIDGFQVTNSRLVEIENFDTPLSRFGEQDLEDLIELYDYKTPLWGRPLKTGDEMPLYPMIFGGIGLTALVALAILIVIGKKRGNNAA